MLVKIDHVVQRIRVYAFAVKGWTKKELASQAKISENSLRNIHDPKWNVSLDTLRDLESVIPDDFAFEQMPELFTKKDKKPTSKGKPRA